MAGLFIASINSSRLRGGLISTVLVGVVLTLSSLTALAGGKDCSGGFTVTISDGRSFSGKQDVDVTVGSGMSAQVRGKFVEFTVNLDTFKVTNYKLTSDITNNQPTVIFARKEPLHGKTLVSTMRLNINSEQLVLRRSGPGIDMKIQAKDCSQGGIFQMEPDQTIEVEHQLGPNFVYCLDALNRVLVVSTSNPFVGRESPETANLSSPLPIETIKGKSVSRWLIQGGGRMGMVTGEDALEPLATDAPPCASGSSTPSPSPSPSPGASPSPSPSPSPGASPSPSPSPGASPSPSPSPTPSPAGNWVATTLADAQVEIKAWTTSDGVTSVHVKLAFPNAGFRVADWGQLVRTGNTFTLDARVERFTGTSTQAVTTTAQIHTLGKLDPGNYTFVFKNSGVTVKSREFSVSASSSGPGNPIDDQREYVRQQYQDFLNREPDDAGWDFWTNNIKQCSDPSKRRPGQTEAECIDMQRTTTSAAFFVSPEFQYTGYYAYRFYKGSLGRQPKLSEFKLDSQLLANGIMVNGQLSGTVVEQNKARFALQWTNRPEFKAIYDSLTNQQYVDRLFETTGINASAQDRQALVTGLDTGSETRASVLQKVVDGIHVIAEGQQQFTTAYGKAFYDKEFNNAFVQMEYFGYMRRDPDDPGYEFWRGKLNYYGNYLDAEMVKSFVVSPEYRSRFGQP